MTASHGAACRHTELNLWTPFRNSQPQWVEPTSLLGVSKKASRQLLVLFAIGLKSKPQVKDLILKRVWRSRKNSSDEGTQVKLSSFGWGLGEIQGFEQCHSVRHTPYPSLPPERLYILHLKSCIKLL